MKELREILVDAIVDLSGDELQITDLVTIAKEDETELALRLVAITEYFRQD